MATAALCALIFVTGGCTGEPPSGTTSEASGPHLPGDDVLDCANDFSWSQFGTPTDESVGVSTAVEAVETLLQTYVERYEIDGRIELHRESGSVVPDNRDVVVARAANLPGGGWGVTNVASCEPYEPFG